MVRRRSAALLTQVPTSGLAGVEVWSAGKHCRFGEHAAIPRAILDRHVIVELLPAGFFFAVNSGWGLKAATVAVTLATIAAVAIGYRSTGRVPVLAIATLAIVVALGMASLLFDDERFIKIRPTVGNSRFASALLVGLAFRPSLLERALAGVLHLTASGWRVLTFCWVAFAVLQAVTNEIVWRMFPTDDWVAFKTVLVPVSIAGYILITRLVAPRFWDEAAEGGQPN